MYPTYGASVQYLEAVQYFCPTFFIDISKFIVAIYVGMKVQRIIYLHNENNIIDLTLLLAKVYEIVYYYIANKCLEVRDGQNTKFWW